jgi:hypothetical protein
MQEGHDVGVWMVYVYYFFVSVCALRGQWAWGRLYCMCPPGVLCRHIV